MQGSGPAPVADALGLVDKQCAALEFHRDAGADAVQREPDAEIDTVAGLRISAVVAHAEADAGHDRSEPDLSRGELCPQARRVRGLPGSLSR